MLWGCTGRSIDRPMIRIEIRDSEGHDIAESTGSWGGQLGQKGRRQAWLVFVLPTSLGWALWRARRLRFISGKGGKGKTLFLIGWVVVMMMHIFSPFLWTTSSLYKIRDMNIDRRTNRETDLQKRSRLHKIKKYHSSKTVLMPRHCQQYTTAQYKMTIDSYKLQLLW